jgi:hypothetical protein
MNNSHLLYINLIRKTLVGMLTVGVQNTLHVIEIDFLHYERKEMDQSPLEIIIQPKSLEKAQSEWGTRMQR